MSLSERVIFEWIVKQLSVSKVEKHLIKINKGRYYFKLASREITSLKGPNKAHVNVDCGTKHTKDLISFVFISL